MALQIEVTKKTVAVVFSGYNVTSTLKCWNDGDNPSVDPAIIDEDVVVYVKGNVEGKTVDDLIDDFESETILIMQRIINEYKTEQALLNKAKLDAAIVNIGNNLNG